jgi:cytochrome c biogenesis protein CcdA
MYVLLAVLTPIAFVSSLARLPGGIAGLVATHEGSKPTLIASAYIAGIFVPQFVFGLLLALGLNSVINQINVWMQNMWRDPDTLFVALQLVIGAVMIVFGYRLSRDSQHRPETTSSTPTTPVQAFLVAGFLTIIGLPRALLYFAAVDLILRAYLNLPGIVKALLYYNFINLLPLMLIVVLRRLLGTRSDAIFAAAARFLERWGKRLIFCGLLVLGLALVADAIGWFLGFPLIAPGFRY